MVLHDGQIRYVISYNIQIKFYIFVFHEGDNILIIGGEGGGSDVELLTMQSNNDLCKPTDLPGGTRSYHSSVATALGVITCGGVVMIPISTCKLITHEGMQGSFPSMVSRRMNFRLVQIGEILYAIGGNGEKNMDKINIYNDKQWVQETIPFSVYYSCVVAAGNKIVVTGGRDRGEVSEELKYNGRPTCKRLILKRNKFR